MSFAKELLPSSVSLPYIDWNDELHQRVVMASLVLEAYCTENDRQGNGQVSPQAATRQLWVTDHFQLENVLRDNDNSVLACIYKLKPEAVISHRSARNAPRIVIAFRGTINRTKSMYDDMKTNCNILLNRLESQPRFGHAIEAVNNIVQKTEDKNVWLAGHSMGSAIALLVGKKMARAGFPLKTYVFNPPFPSLSQGNHETRHIIKSVFKATLAVTVMDGEDDQFRNLSSWIPKLFVNADDRICSGYIGYFRNRKNMFDKGSLFAKSEKKATQYSLRSLFQGKEKEAPHLLPSANLTINRNFNQDLSKKKKGPLWYSEFRKAHGIKQWRDLNVSGENELHLFDEINI